MRSEIIFTQDYSYDVKAMHAEFGELGDGTLTFGPGKATTLQFKLSSLKLREKQTFDEIHVVTEDNQHFTLFDCQYEQLFLSCEQIVSIETSDSFLLAEIEVLDISPWFFEFQDIKGSPGQQIEWVNAPKKISANLKIDDKSLVFEAYPSTNITPADDGHLIKNSVMFSIESASPLNIKNVRQYITDLLAMLSILLGTPVSIESVVVKSDKNRTGYAFFPFYERERQANARDRSSRDYLISKAVFEKCWQTIVQNFYASKLRNPLWLRLSGMKRYSDFWEYKVLGYVTLWESYVSSQTQSLGRKTIPTPKRAVKKFHQKVDQSALDLSEAQARGVKDLADSIFQTKEYTFQEKTDIVIDQTDADVIKIIGLSSNAFVELRNIRDQIAHGKIITVAHDEYPLLASRVEKLTLLITYFAFIDFGLKKDDFFVSLHTTWSRMARGADLNEAHLDKIMGNGEFVTLTNENLLTLKPLANGQPFRCFYRNDNGEVTYSDEDTKAYLLKFRSNAVGNNPNFNELFNKPEKIIRYISSLYFEDGQHYLHFTAAFLFEE